MTIDEALAHVNAGGRVTSPALSQGSVLKIEDGRLRVVFEATGTGYDFTRYPLHDEVEWRKIEGWATYG